MIQNTNTRFVIEKIIKNALYEDLGQNGDITSNSIIDPEVKNNFSLISRSNGVISGLFVANLTFGLIDKNLEFSTNLSDGSKVKNLCERIDEFNLSNDF